MQDMKSIFVITIALAMSDVSMAASEGCPCLKIDQTPLANSSFRSDDGKCLTYEADGSTYCLPIDYGTNECKAHDQDLEPYCSIIGFPGPPDWCGQPWCYVDPNNCNEAHYESSFFPGINLRYSHSTCGGGNTFISWIGDGVSHSFSDLSTLIERYVVGLKLSLEGRVDQVRQFSGLPKNVASECNPNNSCDCIGCESHSCWRLDVDFESTMIALHRVRELSNDVSDVNFMKCLTNDISVAHSRISERENNNENRVGYLYYGDQGTGALVQTPETRFCSYSYDARFRPWYAAAASGPKDVVVVVDTSGSMAGYKIQMAISAIQAIAKTMTWVDYITVISFHSHVSRIYSEHLVAATEEVVSDIVRWAETLRADGGTNFDDPLAEAYAVLEASKNSNDRQTCAQAILFMTDGQASFNEEAFEQLSQSRRNVVVFSYALGHDAAVEPLQAMSCKTGGVFYPVNDASTLPKVMAAYYRYFIKLQDTCSLSWMKYSDAITGATLVAGCSAVFNYGENNRLPPELVGVTCQDLNTVVSIKQLQTCTNRGLDQFIDQIRQESATCPSATTAGSNGKITNECTLQKLRADVSAESVCPSSVTNVCELPPQPTQSSCDRLDPNRFERIELRGCDTDVQEFCAPPQAWNADETQTLSSGSTAAIVICTVICVATVLYLVTKHLAKRKRLEEIRLAWRRNKKPVMVAGIGSPTLRENEPESAQGSRMGIPVAEVIEVEPIPVPNKQDTKPLRKK